MATFKHISSKNADYGAAEQYLTFEHDEFTMKPTLDENGRLMLREDYRIATLNCGDEDFAVACIYPREIYQRGVERKRVELIARDFNEYIVNEPKVSFRNGRYYVMDGQHTIEGCILLNGGEDRPILCKVYTGLTMEQEALLFAEQNGHAAPLSAGIKLRAKVVGGDAPSKAFVAATNRAGLSLNYDSMQLSDYRIGCVGTALKLYDQLGEEIYCEALRHIVEAWEGKPDSFRAAVLRGVMYFVQLYHGQYSEERLVRALSGVHPMELYRVSRDNPAKLPGWRRYVYPIYTTYNGKCRKDALPMKF